MYNYEFLHFERHEELNLIQKRLTRGAPILEVGGGTGYQAKILSDRGFDVTSIDLHDGDHMPNLVFPVAGYDGKTLPFPNKQFGVLFTSHTLECVADLPHFQKEVHRVLSANGIVIHLVSSNYWEFWTLVSGIFDIVPRLWNTAAKAKDGARLSDVFIGMLKRIYAWLFVWKRTIIGSRIRNLIAWRKKGWVDRFKAASFEVVDCEPVDFFFTGHMLFGPALPFKTRQVLAKILGSPAYLFVLKKVDNSVPESIHHFPEEMPFATAP